MRKQARRRGNDPVLQLRHTGRLGQRADIGQHRRAPLLEQPLQTVHLRMRAERDAVVGLAQGQQITARQRQALACRGVVGIGGRLARYDHVVGVVAAVECDRDQRLVAIVRGRRCVTAATAATATADVRTAAAGTEAQGGVGATALNEKTTSGNWVHGVFLTLHGEFGRDNHQHCGELGAQ